MVGRERGLGLEDGGQDRQPPRGLGKSRKWALEYLEDFGAFGLFIARHFKRKVWRVDRSIVKQLQRTSGGSADRGLRTARF